MGKWLPRALAAFFCLSGCAPAPRPAPEIQRWAVYYDDALPAEQFTHLDLVVFDRIHHPPIAPLKGKTITLAYISAGEVHHHVGERKQLEAKGAILFHNKQWDSYAVDLTHPRWRRMLLDKVKDAKKQGFDGIMLDTLDSPLHWAETEAPERAEAMRRAAIGLIREIRRQHPGLKIMVNRGFSILPQIAGQIDYVLAESIYVRTDVSTGQFELFPPITYAQVAEQLQGVTAIARQLQVFTLDYWNPDDVNGLERIYAAQRAQGFIPYVTTPDLRTFTPIPATRPDPS